jgi:hypothetical protein
MDFLDKMIMNKPATDSVIFGIISGIIIQLGGFILVLYINKSVLGYTERTVIQFFQYLMDFDTGRSQIIPKLLSLAAIPDLLLFFVFIWTNKLKAARGVIASVLLLGALIVMVKFF